jgi:predicted DNA-binding protein with PD1-like motif
MPRAVFKLLWDTLSERQEIFAYVKNITKHGDYYWVFAHVTPSFDTSGQVIGFHSNRRVPDRKILESSIIPLYAAVLREEQSHKNGKNALAAGWTRLLEFVNSTKMTYDELIFSL